MIYIGFSYPKNFKLSSWLISKHLKTEYSHVFIWARIHNEEIILEADRFGVRAIHLSEFLKKNKIIRLISMDGSKTAMDGHNDRRVRDVLTYCFKQLGKKYSFLSNLGILFRNIWGRDGEHRFICSELVARAIGVTGKNLDHITPKEVEEYLLTRRNQ